MFINELGTVFAHQKHSEAVEGFDLPLQLYAVHQEYTDRNIFLSGFVQKCVLQIHFSFHLVSPPKDEMT